MNPGFHTNRYPKRNATIMLQLGLKSKVLK